MDNILMAAGSTVSDRAFQGLGVPSTFTTGPPTPSTALPSRVSFCAPTWCERVFRTGLVVSQMWYQGALYPVQDGLVLSLREYGQVPAASRPMLNVRFVPQPAEAGSSSQPDVLLASALRRDAVSARTTSFAPWSDVGWWVNVSS